MNERQRQVTIGLLVGVLVATAVLVLNPWHLHDALDAPIARTLGDLGLPATLNLHAAEFAANIALFVPLGLLGRPAAPPPTAGGSPSWHWSHSPSASRSCRPSDSPTGSPRPATCSANSLGAAIGVGASLLFRRQPVAVAEPS